MNETPPQTGRIRLADVHWPLFLTFFLSGTLANFAPLLEESRLVELTAKALSLIPIFLWALAMRPKRPARAYSVLMPFGTIFALAMGSWAANRGGAADAMRWVVLLAFYAAAARIAWEPDGHSRVIVSVYLGLAAAGGAFSLFALRYSTAVTDISLRRAITGLHPNAQGLISAGTANLALMLFFVMREKKARVGLALVFLCAVAAALVTGSRTALGTMGLTLACVAVLAFGAMQSGKRYLASALLLPLVLAGALLTAEFVLPRIASHSELLVRMDSLHTLAGRRFTWEFVLDNAFVRPIFPIGLGPDLGREWLIAMTGLHAHNGYLQLVTDLGPFVSIPLAWLLCFPAVKALRGLRRAPAHVIMHSGVFLFTIVHSMAEANLDRLANTMNMAFIFSMIRLWQLRTAPGRPPRAQAAPAQDGPGIPYWPGAPDGRAPE